MPENTSFSNPKLSASHKRTIIIIGLIVVGGVILQQALDRSGGTRIEAVPETTASLPATPPVPAAQDQKPEKISTKTDTKDWQEYANEKLGFSVMYPGDFNLRGRVDSDVAILEYPFKGSGDQKALITLARKLKPRGEGPYDSIEALWPDEERFIGANGGSVRETRWIEVEGRRIWEAEEDNRLNNFVGLHRYLKEGDNLFEITLNVAGEKFDDEKMEIYNTVVSTFVISG